MNTYEATHGGSFGEQLRSQVNDLRSTLNQKSQTLEHPRVKKFSDSFETKAAEWLEAIDGADPIAQYANELREFAAMVQGSEVRLPQRKHRPGGKDHDQSSHGRRRNGGGSTATEEMPGFINKEILSRPEIKELVEDLFGPDFYQFAMGQPEGTPFLTAFSEWTSGPTNSPAFKKWFGDSKVVDANGKPLVVYHGTPVNPQSIEEFLSEKVGTLNTHGPGYYFAEKEKYAKIYAEPGMQEFEVTGSWRDSRALASEIKAKLKQKRAGLVEVGGNPMMLDADIGKLTKIQWLGLGEKDAKFVYDLADIHGIDQNVVNRTVSGGVISVYLSIEKPFDPDTDEVKTPRGTLSWGEAGVMYSPNEFRRLLEADGYDGVKGRVEGQNIWVAFNSEQIKTTDNEGTFDPESPYIRKHLHHDQSSHGNRHGLGKANGDEIELDNSLGLSRSEMPQIPEPDQEEFEAMLRANGVTVLEEVVSARQLRPTQRHVSRKRIEHVKDGIHKQVPKLLDKHQYVSRDSYILDGHHRWAAMEELGMEIPIKRIDLPIEELLSVAEDFNADRGIAARKLSLRKHLGPGPHPSGSPQSVHGLQGASGKKRRTEIINRPSTHYKTHNEEGVDTFERFKTGENSFTEERAELHEAVLADILSAGKQKDGNKSFIILGGGAASGKSTLIKNGYIDAEGAVTINSDDIKGQLPEYRERLEAKDSSAASFTHEESSYLSKVAMKRSAEAGYDYLLDGTGNSTLESLRKKTSVAHANGYKVAAEYVTVDTATAEARNYERAKKTGRMVPPSALRHAHQQVSVIFPVAIKEGLFNTARLYDTNDSTLDEDRTELVVSYDDGELTIHNQAKWERFLAKAEGK